MWRLNSHDSYTWLYFDYYKCQRSWKPWRHISYKNVIFCQVAYNRVFQSRYIKRRIRYPRKIQNQEKLFIIFCSPCMRLSFLGSLNLLNIWKVWILLLFTKKKGNRSFQIYKVYFNLYQIHHKTHILGPFFNQFCVIRLFRPIRK